MSMRVVIIGGVAGGMSAAARLRRLDAQAEIIVIERSGYVSYANCGLPYYLGGVIEQESSLLLQTPESLFRRFRIDVRVHTTAKHIDRERKAVLLQTENGSSEWIAYDKLILSPGAVPIVPPLPGIERARTLRNVEDVKSLIEGLAAKPKSAVVIGGGFIGVEAAENLVHREISTTIIEAAPHILAPLDVEMVTPVEQHMRERGVALMLDNAVSSIGDASITLRDGRDIAADLILLAIGVRPDSSLAADAGLALGPAGSVLTNHAHQTNDADIYAIGDAVAKRDRVTGDAVLVPLANLANRHGREVADHICGRHVSTPESLGTAIVKVFDLTVAATGWNERRATAAGLDFHIVHSHPASHAGYYPGATPMSLKLLFAPNGEILGAQGVGSDGVDKRIDVIATAIRGGIPAPELRELELAYAPPYSSAKDPVNMLGYVADNILSGNADPIQWHQVEAARSAGATLIDVRTTAEYEQGHIPGALNIPVDELRERTSEIPTDSDLIVTCAVGIRGHVAASLLASRSQRVQNLDGGFSTWKAAAQPIE